MSPFLVMNVFDASHAGAPASTISRRAVDHDLRDMLDTLVAAFAEDPVWGGWAFPDRARAPAQRREIFSLWLQGALRLRTVRMTQHCEAVAAWYGPEGTASSESEQVELEENARALLGSHADVFLKGCELLESAHPQGEPHYYLSLIGAHPDYRGKGLGMSLLRDNLAMLDASGMPAYLESTNPNNIPRYESVGFRRIGAIDLPGAGPRVDLMWRAPRQEKGTPVTAGQKRGHSSLRVPDDKQFAEYGECPHFSHFSPPFDGTEGRWSVRRLTPHRPMS